MLRFAHFYYFYILAIIPLLIIVFWYLSTQRKIAIQKFAKLSMFEKLTLETSGRKKVLKKILLLSTLAFLILALTGPQLGTRMEEVKQEGVDIFIALDVSLSMKAEDVKPNRLEKAKLEIRNLISRLAGDRIGLIVFSGDAYTQFPLTTDYSAANLFLDVVDVETVPNPGTAIGSAIKQAMTSFNFEDPTTKILVVITDGENNEGDAITQSEEAAKKGVLLYTIGMGSSSGAPIPLYDANGRQTDFKRDRSGNVVLTKLDETSLQQIASIGKGKYYRASNTQDELDAIYKDINALQKREFGVKQFTEFEHQYQYLLAVAIILLLIEIILSDKKIHWLARFNPFKKIEQTEGKIV